MIQRNERLSRTMKGGELLPAEEAVAEKPAETESESEPKPEVAETDAAAKEKEEAAAAARPTAPSARQVRRPHARRHSGEGRGSGALCAHAVRLFRICDSGHVWPCAVWPQ